MKKGIIVLCMIVAGLSSCDNKSKDVDTNLINIAPTKDNDRKSTELPEIKFDEEVYNFGEILEGKVIEHTFSFENVGNGPLLLSNVESTCGCTVVKNWSKEPYAPGEEGTITVQFDSNKRPGNISKSINVLCNTYPSSNVLKLEGKVIGPN